MNTNASVKDRNKEIHVPSVAEDIKTLKVKAMLAFASKRYADAEVLFSAALDQASQIPDKDGAENPDCAQLRQSISSCQEKQK